MPMAKADNTDKTSAASRFSILNLMVSSLAEGVLEMMPDGYGFFAPPITTTFLLPMIFMYRLHRSNLFGLKTGDTVLGSVRPPKEGEKYFALLKVESINGKSPEEVRDRVPLITSRRCFPFKSSTCLTRPPTYHPHHGPVYSYW
jgi:transcription termination factor Rho